MAKIVLKLKSNVSYVDSCDVDYKRFGREISSLSSNAKIKSYHHADSRFVTVAAASIIAKVSRDRSIHRLNKNFNLGSGYPSDKKTVLAVKKILSKKKSESFIRMSWKPVQKIISKINNLDMRYVTDYMPSSFISYDSAFWFSNAFKDGFTKDGNILIDGNLSKYPFYDDYSGHSYGVFPISNLQPRK